MTANEIGALRLHHVARAYNDLKQRAETPREDDEARREAGSKLASKQGRKERRKGGKHQERTRVPASFCEPGRIDGAQLRVLEERIRPSFDLHTIVHARAHSQTQRPACRLPVYPGRCNWSFKLAREASVVFTSAVYGSEPAGLAINPAVST